MHSFLPFHWNTQASLQHTLAFLARIYICLRPPVRSPPGAGWSFWRPPAPPGSAQSAGHWNCALGAWSSAWCTGESKRDLLLVMYGDIARVAHVLMKTVLSKQCNGLSNTAADFSICKYSIWRNITLLQKQTTVRYPELTRINVWGDMHLVCILIMLEVQSASFHLRWNSLVKFMGRAWNLSGN